MFAHFAGFWSLTNTPRGSEGEVPPEQANKKMKGTSKKSHKRVQQQPECNDQQAEEDAGEEENEGGSGEENDGEAQDDPNEVPYEESEVY